MFLDDFCRVSSSNFIGGYIRHHYDSCSYHCMVPYNDPFANNGTCADKYNISYFYWSIAVVLYILIPCLIDLANL